MDFRPLFGEMLSWRSPRTEPSLYYEVLLPWMDANSEHIKWLRDFGERVGDPVPVITADDRWDLYSISRVHDALLAASQAQLTINDVNDNFAFYSKYIDRWNLTPEQYLSFMQALGFQPREQQSFTPILHEIVHVDQSADKRQPITLIGEYWPALMLGDLLFSRAGVYVEGGEDHVIKHVAERSAMFWTWMRLNRPTQDLSMGWGSNSQWRTDFRRDYLYGDRAHLNVDARPAHARDNVLTPEKRHELLLNRCFIKTLEPTPAVNLWPYDETAVVPFP